MNYFLNYLHQRRSQLNLAAYGVGKQLSAVLLTPRFRASSHVVALILADGRPQPALVVKVPRLSDGGESLRREAAGLRHVQSLRPDGFDSIPKLVAFEEFCGRPILVQSALVGRAMDPPRVRSDFPNCAAAGIRLLRDFTTASQKPAAHDQHALQRIVDDTLDEIGQHLADSREERELIDRTREKLTGLAQHPALPSVLEHGDFSSPNLMLLPNGEAGIVDWELAAANGLPLQDLFFFLAYLAFARDHVRENGRCIPAIQSAFFAENAWARDYAVRFGNEYELPASCYSPLFVLCWVRYVAGLLRRLSADEPLSRGGISWLRQNRYYAIWRYSVECFDQLRWTGAVA